MDKITVAELATECSVKNQVVLAELKRLGLYVVSPSATIDVNFAETIRKKILAQKEAEAAKALEAGKKKEAAAAKKAEKKTAKKAAKKTTKIEKTAKTEKAAKKTTARAAPKRAAKAAAAPRKARKTTKKAEKAAEKPEEAPPKVSLAPRKGRKHYDRESEEFVDIVVARPPEKPAEEKAPSEAAKVEALPSKPEEPKEAAEAPPVAAEPKPVEPEKPLKEAAPEKAPEALKVAAPEPQKPEKAAEEAPALAPPGKPRAEPPAPAKVFAKKIVIPKAKTKILMRTSTEKLVTPEITDRILKGLREEKPVAPRAATPSRPLKRKKTVKAAPPERAAKVIELPRPPEKPEDYKPIDITEGVTIKELAEKMDIKSKYIIQKLISKGILASINQALDLDAAKEVCAEFGFRADVISFEQEAVAKQEVPDKLEDYAPRPPVVTIMGHVDHGKTSLLDVIRETNVTATEAGGITQHIGAYQVDVRGRSIVFLDTPGHEAFTMMRSRGAQATDIVVLVVAADDGVMPQTIEAIDHAKAANVSIIVAINKIDKPDAQIDRVKQSLADQGLLSEDWGGDVVMVPVSAKKNTNIDELLEMILLVADLKDLKANPKRLASGIILEASSKVVIDCWLFPW